VEALAPIPGLVTAFHQMTEALNALCRTRKRRVTVTCQSANLLSGETGAYVPVSFVEAQAPIQGPVTAFQRMMAALDALSQTRKNRVPVTCPNANSLSGENGVCALASFVEVLVPIPGLVIAFLQMTAATGAPCQTRKRKVPVTCQSASLQSGESGAYVPVSFVMALAPIPEPVTVFLLMTAAMDALCQMRRRRVPATCQLATGPIGESGANVQAQIAARLAP